MKKKSKIEDFFAHKQWHEARKEICIELKLDPENHWLWARLASAHFNLKDYSSALQAAQKSLEIMPGCQLALWEKAQALEKLDSTMDAIKVYQAIIKPGITGSLSLPCSEGRAWVRAVLSDSYYRLARCFMKIKNYEKAKRYLKKSLGLRGPGIRSIYFIEDVRAFLAKIEGLRKEPKSDA